MWIAFKETAAVKHQLSELALLASFIHHNLAQTSLAYVLQRDIDKFIKVTECLLSKFRGSVQLAIVT